MLFSKNNIVSLLVMMSSLPMQQFACENANKVMNKGSNVSRDDSSMASAFAQLITKNARLNEIDSDNGLTALESACLIQHTHPQVHAVLISAKIQKDLLEKLLNLKPLINKPELRYFKGGKYQEKEKRIRKLYQQTCEFIAKNLPENN